MKSIKVLMGVLVLVSGVYAGDMKKVDYPQGYRDWTHVKTMMIEPGHALENPFGGIHHIYANKKAKKGLKTGKYEDGATLVFDLLNYDRKEHAVSESKRKLVGVMYKDQEKFSKTGGWGFEGFAGDSKTERLVTDGGVSCFACHSPQKTDDFVFSKYRD